MPLADATVEIVADYATFTPRLRAGLRKATAAAGKDADRGFRSITESAERAADAMAEAYEEAAGETVTSLRGASVRGKAALAQIGDIDLRLDFADDARAAVGDVVTAFETGSGRARAALASIGEGGGGLGGLGAQVGGEAGKASAAVASMASGITAELSGLGGAGRAAGRDLAAGLESGLSGARSAGRAAGADLADGVEQGARGKVKLTGAFDDLNGEAKTAGKEAGRSLADSISGALAAAGIGAGLGASLAATMDVSKATDTLRAQLGATQADTARYGKVAGDLFANNYGESIGDVTATMGTLIQQLPGLKTASDASVKDVTTDALNLSRVFGVDVTESTRAVASMLRTGVAPNAEAAFDILTKGFQTGANQGQDLLDTFNEYSVQFQQLGLSGEDALGLINQMLAGGARNSDQASDAIRTFTTMFGKSLSTVNSKGVATPTEVGSAFANMGFDISQAAKEAGTGAYALQADLAAGGDRARSAFAQVTASLGKIDDPTKRSAAAVALFGSQAEDMGNALYNANLDTAAKQVGDVAGATDELDAQGAAKGFSDFTRSLQVLGGSLGTTVLPSLTALVDKLSGVTDFLTEHKDVAGPIATGLLGIASAGAAIKAISFGVNATGLPAAVKGVGNLTRGLKGAEDASGVMGKIGSGLRSLGGAGKSAEGGAGALSKIADKAKVAGSAMGGAASTAADYAKRLGGVVGRGAAIAADTAKLVAQKAVMLAIKGATALWTGAQWLLNAAMAANPIGLIVLAIVALVAIVYICYKRFDSFRAIVDKVWGVIKNLGSAIGGFFVKAWQKIIDTLGEVGGKLGDFFSGLPGKIAGWLGDLGGKLKDFFGKAFGKIWDVYVGLAKKWAGFWTGLLGKVLGWLGDIGGKLKDFFGKAFGKIWDVYLEMAVKWANFWTGLLGKVLGWLGDIGGKLKAFFVTAFGRVWEAYVELLARQYIFWSGLVGKILGWLGDMGGKLAGVFRAAMSAVATAVSNGWTATATFFSGLGGKILGLLSSVGNAIAAPFRNAWAGAKTAVSNGISGVLGVIRGLPGQIGALAGRLYDAGKNLIGRFVSGLGNVGSTVLDFGKKIVGYLKDKLNGGIGTVNGWIGKVNDKIPFGNPIPTIPRLAYGDIVRKATLAIVGEAGPEVVIPLTRPARAEELARRSGLLALLELRGLLGAPAGDPRPAPGPPAVTGTATRAVDRSVHIGELHVHHHGTDTERATRRAVARAARAAMAGI